MRAPLPARRTACPNCLAEDILTFGRMSSSRLSLKLDPSRYDIFSTGLTLSFCSMAIRLLALNSGSGGDKKGPATNPSWIQFSNVSVNIAPCVVAEFAFLISSPFKWES